MNKFITWLEKWLPNAWAVLASFTITGTLIGLSIKVVIWIGSMLGGM